MNKNGGKRKSTASEAAVRAKRSISVHNAQLKNVLGSRRGASVLIRINDVVIDVFQFLRRQELDTLQIVSRRLNAIVVEKMTLVCLRHLKSAKISPSSAQRQFVLVVEEIGAKKKTRFPTGVVDEAAATRILFNACRSSRVERLELYEKTCMSGRFFDSLALHAPTIFLDELYIGKRTLANGVVDDEVLRALQSFAGLCAVNIETWINLSLQNCLMCTCFKAGASLAVLLRPSVFGVKFDPAAVEDALLEFCFSTCDEQYAMRERRLSISFSESLGSDFVQRWIEKAEAHDCGHKLTLHIKVLKGWKTQDITALDAYKKRDQIGDYIQEVWFESVSGRRWTARYIGYARNVQDITFEINH